LHDVGLIAMSRKNVVALPPISETRFQNQILQAAFAERWIAYHPWLSIKSAAGWPDLFLVKGNRALALEVKKESGKATPAQQAWLTALDEVPGITARCVRPSDWDAIVKLLRGEG
jgi:hypothetical protein